MRWPFPRRVAVSVRSWIEQHMGASCIEAHTLAHVIKPVERVNLQLALDEWLDSDHINQSLIGYRSEYGDHAFGGLAHAVSGDELEPAPVERETIASDLDTHLDCVTRGVYLLHHNQTPITLMIRPQLHAERKLLMEVLSLDRAVARDVLDTLLDGSARRNVYRGKVLSLETENEWSRDLSIRFHRLPEISRDAVVLPEEVMQVIERNVMGWLLHAERLRAAGRSTRHGLLFHGKPGTGKTLIVRYLAHACPDHTVILLTGRQLGLIRESCQIARLLAPSIVVLEDVDLVAHERSQNKCPTVLHELMDEMDGLGTKADCIFILTTNRAEILEPALAARPGRIDQAIEFPLPDAVCRRRLFELYGDGLDLNHVDFERWVEKTEGVSPAFIEELLSKAALLAAERQPAAQVLEITDADVDEAVRELVYFGGELTQRLLGYKSDGRST